MGISFESCEKALINGVPAVIQEMAFNLIENAVKYNKENGSVFVKIEKTGQEYVCLSVKDTGIGIEEKEQERIFERFYRVEKSRSKTARTHGTGLGLSIVKHGAKYHNAKVSVKSTLGEGSEFRVVFSLKK